ncbi:hypothetical protein SUGI_0228050 [Cryptomeria japonica]|nr:hypothetical protein SUGI_0228050 [Cryptomeria japonica]
MSRYIDACQTHGSSPNNLILSAFAKANLLKSLDEACILEIIIDQLTDIDIYPLTEALFLVNYSELDAVDVLHISPCVVFNGQDLLALMRSIGPKLRTVDLKDVSLGKDSLRDLLERGLPCQLLNLSSCCVRKLNMSGQFFALHTLKLDFNNLTSLPKDCFISMPKLMRLSMCETGITNFWTTCAALSRLPSLLELRFQNCLCCNDTGQCPQSSSEKLNSLVHESIASKPGLKAWSTDWSPIDQEGVRFPDSELSETEEANFHDMFSDDESVARYHLGHSSNDNSSDESDIDSRFHLRGLVTADIPTDIQQQTIFLGNLKRERNEITHMDYNNANILEQPTEHLNTEESFFETNEGFSMRNEELILVRDRETPGSLNELSHNSFDCCVSKNTFYSAAERTIPVGLSAISTGEGTCGDDLNVAFPEMPVAIAVRRDASSSYHPSPICFQKHYREFMIASLPDLKVLDNVPISQLERERAQTIFLQHFELLPYNRRDKENVTKILNGRETGVSSGIQSSSKLKRLGMANGNAVSFRQSICASKMAAWPDIHPISKLKKSPTEINKKFRPRQFEYHQIDSNLMVFGTLDGEVVVINHESGKLVGHVQSVGANHSILGLCWFSKDPTKLIAGSDNGTLQLYDVNRMRSALLSGRCGANSSNRNPSSYTYEEFESLTSVHINATDNYFLASGYSKHVALYDICSGRRLQVFEDLHGEHINVVKFSHHSPNIFATSSFDKDIKMWDLRQKPTHPLYTNTSTKGNVMVCFSHDDHYLLSSAVDNEVKQHLAVDGRLHTKFDIASTGGVQNYTRSYYMNGKDYIISGSCEENVVRICCAQTGRRLRDLALEGRGSRSSLYVQSLRGDPFRDFHLSVLAAYINPDSKSEILKINLLSSDTYPKDRDSDLQYLPFSGMGG